MNQNLQKIFDLLRRNEALTAEEKNAISKAIEETEEALTLSEFKLSRTEQVKKTTEVLLEETIEELEQKRKDVEAKNRELEIETGLEKVRAIALSMKSPADMLEVCREISGQIEKLGITITRNIQTAIISESKGIYLNYEYFTRYRKTVVTEVEYKLQPDVAAFVGQMLSGPEAFFTTSFEGEKLEEWIKYQERSKQFVDPALRESGAVYYYFYSIGPGALGISTYSPLPETGIQLFKRFKNVFELAYRRFLDIELAIAQAREARIETALERVRAIAMAMRKPADLLAVCEMLFKELQSLGFEGLRNSMINIHNDEEGYFLNYDYSDFAGPVIARVNYNIHPTIEYHVKQTRSADDAFFEYSFTGSQLKNWKEFRKKSNEYDDPRIEQIEALHYYFYSIGTGSIGISTFSGINNDQREILKRFRNVFSLSYQRYMDITLAEQQAKEAQIELALERVRARTMAMQKSYELMETSSVLYQQLKNLGEPVDQFSIGIINEKENIVEVSATLHGNKIQQASHSIDEPLVMNKIYQHWKKGEKSFVLVQEGKDLIEYNKLRNNLVGAELFPVTPGTAGQRVMSVVYFSNGMLALATSEQIPKESMRLLERFAGVFDLTYTRFLDLQKAEAQAREARIEAALEKVRSSTMGMQKSNELVETAFVLYQQFKLLGETPIQITIGTINEKENRIEFWVTDMKGNRIESMSSASVDEPTLIRKIYNGWKKDKKSFTITLHGKELQAWINYRNLISGFDDKNDYSNSSRSISVAYFSKGLISISCTEPASPETIQLLERFAGVLELTYTRFLDLQKAEAQAKEARIEAALEKVRSRTMGMQKSDDLFETSVVLFHQLKELGESPERIFIALFDEKDKNYIEIWGTGQGGDRLNKLFRAPVSEPTVINKIALGWTQNKSSVVIDLSGNELKEYLKFLEKIGIPVTEGVMTKRRVQSVACFSKGGIGITTPEPVSQETLSLLERFAAVFDLTYTRFLDLQKAEAQAREARIEAALERVRAKAMAMHNSEDLAMVIGTFYKELGSLSITPRRVGISLIDKESRLAEISTMNTTDEGDPMEVIGSLKITGHPVLEGIFEHWESQEEYHPLLRGKEIKEYNEFMKPHVEFPDYPHDQVQHGYYFMFTEGWVYAWTEMKLETGELNIFRRFTSVLSLTYRRYKDLRDAEAQARESHIQLALERVRARTMAMQKSDELPQAANLLFKQIQSLGMPAWSAGYCIWDDDKLAITLSMSSEGILQPTLKMPLTEDPSLKHFREAYERGESFFVEEVGGEALKEHYVYLRTLPGVKETLDDIEKAGFPVPTFQIFHLAYFKQGFLLFITYEQVPESHDIFKRFAKVFEQTYTRFLDLQKAEAQAREAQIEAALEKVRSRTMGMQKSEELKAVIQVVYEQFIHLNILIEHTGFIIDYKANDDMHIWLADQQEIPTEVTIPYFDCAHWNSFKEAKENGIDFFANHLGFEEKNRFYQELFKIVPGVPEEAMEYYFNSPGVAISTVLLENIGLYIENFSAIPYTDEENNTLMRFGKVFQQTYTRFLDLQKAEAQAREAQIELGLERVRVRAMAMQKSDELKELIGTLFTELTKLDFVLTRCLIMIYDLTTNGSTWWMANSEAPSDPIGLYIKYHEHSPYLAYIKAWKERNFKWQYILEGTVKKEWDDFLFTETELSHLPDFVIAGMKAPNRVYLNASFNSFGNLTLATLEPLSNEHFDVLLRFAKVFDLTYTRFNDLKQAEAQAIEAKIEAALERVRSRTMAMQKTDELLDAAELVHKELSALGINSMNVSYAFVDEDEKYASYYSINPVDGRIVPIPFIFPHTETEVMRNILSGWKTQESLNVIELNEKATLKHQTYIGEHIQQQLAKNNIPFSVEEFLTISPKKAVLSTFNFSKGYLFNIGGERLSKTQEELMLRFTKVFEQTYTRFLDLQKAEAQALEARIEASLEKVRSRSLAMHKSDELQDVVHTVFEKLNELDVELYTAIIFIFAENSKDVIWWLANRANQQYARILVPYADNRYLADIFEAKEKGKDFFSATYLLEEKNEMFQHLFENTDFKQVPEEQKQFLLERELATMSVALSKNTGINITSYTKKTFSEKENEILKRFAKVFDQAYTRFLDLQKAEANAKEAKIEASLERVRSRAMAMHISQDLADTIGVFYHELHTFSITPIRCGVGLLDREERVGELFTWNTTEQGKALELVGRLKMEGHPVLDKVYESWLTQTEYHPVLRGNQIKEYYTVLRPQIAFPDYTNDDVQYGYFFFFKEGGVYAWTEKEMKEDELQIYRRFTSVLSLTYKRYRDLQQAEAQAREARIEAALEKVRARAMAMNNSEELGELVAILFEELLKLNLVLARCIIWIFDKDTLGARVWMANSEDKKTAESYYIKRLNHPYYKAIIKGWKEQNPKWVYDLRGSEKRTIDELLLNETELSHLPEKVKAGLLSSEHTIVSGSFNNFGLIEASGPTAHSDEELEILNRFGKVFDLTYTRFNDLKHAEAQAREATIEAALEKVRGKAMAMHNSNDLTATASQVFTELRKLGISPMRSGVSLHNKENRRTKLYSATTSPEGDHLLFEGEVLLDHHPVLSEIYESWLRNEDYFPVLNGDLLKTYYESLENSPGINVPGKQSFSEQYGFFIAFSEGDLYGWSGNPFSETEIKILKRFASVIDLTFRRFIELQKSEANAREAIKQAALDRVRAEIASMRKVDDLERITPLIWNELIILGIPFIRCGVFIMDDAQKLIHTFLSTPDGKAIAAFHIPYTTPGNFAEILRHWQDKKIYTSHWEEPDFAALAETLVKQGAIPSPEQYLKTLPQGGVHLHFLPFLQGMMYVGNIAPLDEDEIALIQSLADSFSTAYARYEDFNKLESAKQQIEKTLVDLKQAQTQLVQSEKMASLGELTAGIAHEIQNPLNFVNNFSEVNKELIEELKIEKSKLVARNGDEHVYEILDDIQNNLEKIIHHGRRADAIVKGMLQHSRSSSGIKEPTDINALADEYLRLAYHGLRAKDKTFNAIIKTGFDESIEIIDIIPQNIGRVLLNLYNNAFYAVSEKAKQQFKGYDPTVLVNTKKEGAGILISVIDNGNGIPQKIADKIFQPFFTTKPTGQGTGLGLSLAYDIIKAHGGEIKVNSKEDEGTEFTISIPG